MIVSSIWSSVFYLNNEMFSALQIEYVAEKVLYLLIKMNCLKTVKLLVTGKFGGNEDNILRK